MDEVKHTTPGCYHAEYPFIRSKTSPHLSMYTHHLCTLPILMYSPYPFAYTTYDDVMLVRSRRHVGKTWQEKLPGACLAGAGGRLQNTKLLSLSRSSDRNLLADVVEVESHDGSLVALHVRERAPRDRVRLVVMMTTRWRHHDGRGPYRLKAKEQAGHTIEPANRTTIGVCASW